MSQNFCYLQNPYMGMLSAYTIEKIVGFNEAFLKVLKNAQHRQLTFIKQAINSPYDMLIIILFMHPLMLVE